MHLCKSTSNVPRLPSFWKCHKTRTFLLTGIAPAMRNGSKPPNMWCFEHFDFEMSFTPQRRALFRHLNFQNLKVVRTCGVLNILPSKCASCHNRVHFFDIATSKNAPNVKCFTLFHWQMCVAPQRRALFPHLNFQKWSERGVFCTF